MEKTLSIHNDILNRFARLKEKGLLAHAYLFIGPREIGKSETALALAKMLNCLNAGSGAELCAPTGNVCASCRKIEEGNHPDIHVIGKKDDSQFIKIEQVRSVISQAHLVAFEAQVKIFIIKDAGAMTIEGANALLKTLEEPSGSSLIVLTSAAPEKLPETVRSRAQTVHFLPKPNEEIIQYLEGEYIESFAASHFLSFFAEGCLKRALRLEEEDFFERKNGYLDDFVFGYDCDTFIKEIASDKNQAGEFLLVCLSWVRDAILLKSGVEDKRLVNLDRKNELDDFQTRFNFDELNGIYKQVVATQKLLSDNLNIRMSLHILKEQFNG